MLYRYMLRPLLFRLSQGDPEVAHERTMALLALLSATPGLMRWLAFQRRLMMERGLERTVFGLNFPNPVGLAAGMDKDGVAIPAWAAMGFGFVEVGTVTWYAQPGNPRPRIFRLPGHGALINRMGFNNHGAVALTEQLGRLPWLPIPVGISLGKSRVTPLEEASDDYCTSLRLLYDYASYFAVNVSSPNTPGLRSLQGREQLDLLLERLQRENIAQSRFQRERPRPLLVKIAPDLSEQAISELLEVCQLRGISGIIATNTTIARTGIEGAPAYLAEQVGGLSGRPLAKQARRIVRFIHKETGGRLPIIGVGGIFTPDDALRMIDAGASLIQVYSGLVYEGPGLVRRLTDGLAGTRSDMRITESHATDRSDRVTG